MVRQILIYTVVIAMLLMILGVSGAALYFTLTGGEANHPALSVVTYTPSEPKAEVVDEQPTQTVPLSAATKTHPQATPSRINPTALSSATPSCGLTTPMKLLYINLGKEGENSPSQAVRMVGINPFDKTINIVSYPCDLWISTPSLVKDYTISAIRLCSLIQLVKNTPGKNPSNAEIAQAIQTALEDTFQVKSDQYLITTTDSLVKSVDMLNGIDYISPETNSLSGVNLQKGTNPVNSSAISSLFSASSLDSSPWDMIERQNEVLVGIDQKFISLSTINLADLIKESNSESSISDQDMASLTCTLKDIPADQIKFPGILKEDTTTTPDGSITVSDMSKILDEMKEIFNPVQQSGTLPSQPASSPETVIPTETAQPVIEATQAPPPISTQASPPTQAPAPLQDPAQSGSLDGKTLVTDRCTQCHGLSPVQRKHTAAEWQTILADMINRGAQLNTDEKTAVFNYLSSTYGR
jgi:anionic cell wall polymer biosynthesis LytR-Cps2A-Psr (LCP) family protein